MKKKKQKAGMTPAQYRERRKELGMSQQELADLLGLHWTTVSRRERATKAITREAELAILALRSDAQVEAKA